MADSKIANPAPLGLAAFGITTLLLSSANAGLWGSVGAGAAVPTALFYGGLTQLLAGMWEFMRGSTFGATAFSSFGAFWLTVWYGLTHGMPAFGAGLGVFFLCFGLATFVLWIAAIKIDIHHNLLFLMLALTFAFLSYGNWGHGHPHAVKIGGWTGLITAVIALYIVAKTLINESWEKVVLP
jgi:succinate-acetate transporter protein